MEIKQKLIPATLTKTRPRIAMSPKYITCHTTANTSKGANALAHANLQYKGNSRTASWHFTCDENEIYQSIPTNEVAYHAGTKAGNTQSIGIEICVNSDGNFEKAKDNAVWLIKYLMAKHSIPISRVVPHKHWSGKDCPHEILPYWSQFINQIKGSVAAVSTGNRLLKLTTPYMRGDDVKEIQEILGVTADGVYGPITMNKVTKFQKANGLATDGIIGPLTWKAFESGK